MTDSEFVPGDLIRQRYQARAPNRLVINKTDYTDVVLVLCPKLGFLRVLTWGHTLITKPMFRSRK